MARHATSSGQSSSLSPASGSRAALPSLAAAAPATAHSKPTTRANAVGSPLGDALSSDTLSALSEFTPEHVRLLLNIVTTKPDKMIGWKLYDLETGEIFVSRDVKFYELECPFAKAGDAHVGTMEAPHDTRDIDTIFLDDLESVLEVSESSLEPEHMDSSAAGGFPASPATASPVLHVATTAGSLDRDSPANAAFMLDPPSSAETSDPFAHGEYMEKLEEIKNKGIEINPDKVYLEVVGGQKKGKVYGLGSASQMYYKSDLASQLTASSSTPSMISQLSSQVEELKKMAEENHNKVEESQKIAAESLKYAKEFVENHEIEKATWKKEKLAMQKTLQEIL
uniref:Uncharacterized protein n=1 Tax=Chenopodium quinoa TaxID=63459 RepID=A0A803MGS0_CHEQI